MPDLRAAVIWLQASIGWRPRWNGRARSLPDIPPERAGEKPNDGVHQEHQRAERLHRHGIGSLFEPEKRVKRKSEQQDRVG